MNDLSLNVEEGQIVSVIGPNGAGKTTLFNLITGVYTPDEGDVRLNGQSLVGKKPDQIVEAGIARTFQNLRLFMNLTILDNVRISQHYKYKPKMAWYDSVLRTPKHRRAEKEMYDTALEKLSFFGPRLMSFRLHQPVYVLSYANRRRTEMARAMATGAKMLLLDEPSAGMNPKETKEITQIIKRMRDEGGYTILLVEHKMNLVGEISDKKVIEAYLGQRSDDESEIAKAAAMDGRTVD